jgi:hypothetical protein
MHAVVVRSTIDDLDEGRAFLREEAVPLVSQAPGFVAAYWITLEGNQGLTVLVFESEGTARSMADQVGAPSGAVTNTAIEVGEVVEHI